jgi:superfamily II RNA helicase
MRRRSRKIRIPPVKARADPRLRETFAAIGTPEQGPFQPDPFQLAALQAIQHADCLVTAPTGAGKTWIAERAIAQVRSNGGRAWYASPLKALSNSKHAEFSAIFCGEVGILTGDRKENTDAPIIVGTTEILRNQLYDAMYAGEDVRTDLVILDEAHFLGDRDRGVVWEEIMIYLPSRIPMLMLSATIGNAHQIAEWLAAIRGQECIVVEEVRRPVELCPLFLHPSGMLYPLFAPGKGQRVDRKVWSYVALENPPLFALPRELPPFGEIIRVLRKYDLLPALFFLKSRAGCDRALNLCQVRDAEHSRPLRERIDELMAQSPHIAQHPQRWQLEHMAVGAHHGGQLPLWKLVLETLMTEGLLDAIFATSTVSAGVNFPARSVVFFNSDRYNGHEFVPLTPTEFHQMIGRAGRRGMDRIGFAVTVPGPYMDIPLIARLYHSPPSDVWSQLRIDFGMTLNLLLSHTPAQVEALLEESFATYLQARRQQTLVRHFRRHLRFLQETGYVSGEGTLTDLGRWASQLRVDQPLMIAEGLRQGVLRTRDPAILAGLMASFVHDRETDETIDERTVPKKLEGALIGVHRTLRPFALRLKRGGFDARPLFVRPALAMHAWASGRPWSRVLTLAGMAEGDFAMLVSRTADHLRHVRNLGDVFPEVTVIAGQGIDLIMRDPVVLF